MKKQRITKKVLSLTMSVLMLATMLPTNVYATETVSTPSPRSGDIEINETTFPDANFRKYVDDKFDTIINDGFLSQDEIKVSEIRIDAASSTVISNLKGIEHFTALTRLICSDIDLASLDLSENTDLTELYCSDNQLTSLDVRKNTKLTYLDCSDNSLKSLDLSKNTDLTELSCGDNQITSLDLNLNPALTNLFCYGNQLINLDLSKNPALIILDFSMNPLGSVDLSKNVKLTELSCGNSKLSSLDVSANVNLEELRFDNIPSDQIPPEYEYIKKYSNEISSLDLSENIVLKQLDCSYNQLTSLGVSKNRNLEALICSDNQLASLDLSENINLGTFVCSNNKFISLDVSKNGKLKALLCSNNQLTSLDVSKNEDLEYLLCSNNQLTSLDLSNNINLDTMDCSNQNPSITFEKSKGYNLSAYDTNFDMSKVSGIEFKDDGSIVGAALDTSLSYSYDIGFAEPLSLRSDGKTMDVTLTFTEKADTSKLDEAKPLVEKAITDLAVTNETTDKNILDAVTTAITDVDGVTVSWKAGSPVITLATQDKEGSIIGTIVLTSGSKTVEISVNKVISKLSSSNKLDDAKSLVEKAIKDMTVTNKTTSQDVLDTVKNSISSLNGVTASWKAGSPTITKATSDKEGSIIGTIILTNGSNTIEISVNKTIYKLIQQVIKSTGETDKVKVSGMISEHGKLYVELIEVKDGYDDILKKIDTVKNAIIGSFEARIVGGTYEGKLIVSFNIGSKYDGKTITIYHQKEDKTIEMMTTVCKNGEAVITVDELSPFVLTINKSDVPQTSDSSAMMTYIGLATLTCVVGYVLKKKKEVNE